MLALTVVGNIAIGKGPQISDYTVVINVVHETQPNDKVVSTVIFLLATIVSFHFTNAGKICSGIHGM